MKASHYLLLIQGIYYLITAIWPLADINSFLSVTGPKTDVWLVKTVAALLIPVSLTILAGLRKRKNATSSIVLATTSAMAFLIIDFYYSLNGTIGSIYMVDGVVQAGLLAMWAVVVAHAKLSYK